MGWREINDSSARFSVGMLIGVLLRMAKLTLCIEVSLKISYCTKLLLCWKDNAPGIVFESVLVVFSSDNFSDLAMRFASSAIEILENKSCIGMPILNAVSISCLSSKVFIESNPRSARVCYDAICFVELLAIFEMSSLSLSILTEPSASFSLNGLLLCE